ncbi:hypothetical protein AMECASPLE_014494 [Ameca splendens]|uniref:PABC domain-containing protein n=1 Tax=Ameca splendens TaxID=208324 RepID=A0ABV0YCN1_9TELE
MDKEDLDTFGERLYSLIYPKHKESAAKLTGMLLELPEAVLSQVLQDEAMLTAAVEKALRALQLAPSRYNNQLENGAVMLVFKADRF